MCRSWEGSVTLALVMEPAAFSCLFRHIDPHGHKSQSERAMTRRALGGGVPEPLVPTFLTGSLHSSPRRPPTPRKNSAPPRAQAPGAPAGDSLHKGPATSVGSVADLGVAPLGLPRSQSHAPVPCSLKGHCQTASWGPSPLLASSPW